VCTGRDHSGSHERTPVPVQRTASSNRMESSDILQEPKMIYKVCLICAALNKFANQITPKLRLLVALCSLLPDKRSHRA
jgi:hypothetical protein